MSVTEQLVALCARPVTDNDLQRAVIHVVDWLGCAAIGSSAAHAPALWEGSSLLGITNDPWQELLYESSLGNILEMDDVHRTSLVHPGSVVVPASLFLARHLSASGPELLTAIIRGYEAMIRFGSAVGPTHYSLLHNTSTCGVLGATAAACSLLKLDQKTWVDAFGHAVTQAAGLWQVRLEPCMSKQWHVARAAQTGVQSAFFAKAGVVGPKFIFEGQKGYFKAHCPDGDIESITRDSKQPWSLYETSFKPWPACRHAHPAIDACLALREKLLPSALLLPKATRSEIFAWLQPRIHEVCVGTYSDAIDFCDNLHPTSPSASRFSIQHAIALVLLGGTPRLEDFDTPSLANEQTRLIREKIRVFEDSNYNHRYPHHFGASVQLAFTDGTLLNASVNDTLGDPEKPMSTETVYEKANALMSHAGWPSDVIRFQLDACTALAGDSAQTSRLKPIKVCADQAQTTQG